MMRSYAVIRSGNSRPCAKIVAKTFAEAKAKAVQQYGPLVRVEKEKGI